MGIAFGVTFGIAFNGLPVFDCTNVMVHVFIELKCCKLVGLTAAPSTSGSIPSLPVGSTGSTRANDTGTTGTTCSGITRTVVARTATGSAATTSGPRGWCIGGSTFSGSAVGGRVSRTITALGMHGAHHCDSGVSGTNIAALSS